MSETYTTGIPPQPVSKTSLTVAGIPILVYGLGELGALGSNHDAASSADVACLWLFHGRQRDKESMEPVAAYCINDWNAQRQQKPQYSNLRKKGLIAVSFDQRNHGERLVDARANKSWKQGNSSHAQDMFSIFHGTFVDTTLLLDHLPGYIFPKHPAKITQNLALGVSLGGHVAWLLLMHEPRITAVVPIIGCPDYFQLMKTRAKQTELVSGSDGSAILDTEHFSRSLVDVVRKWDPASLILEPNIQATSELRKRAHLTQILDRHLRGKRVLVLSGEEDKDVPYSASASFLGYLKDASTRDEGLFKAADFEIRDHLFEGIKHSFSPKMVEMAVSFVTEMVRRE